MNVVPYYRQINSWGFRFSWTLSYSKMFIIKKIFLDPSRLPQTNRKNPASQPTRRGRGMMALEMYAYSFHLFFCFLPGCSLLTTVSDIPLFFFVFLLLNFSQLNILTSLQEESFYLSPTKTDPSRQIYRTWFLIPFETHRNLRRLLHMYGHTSYGSIVEREGATSKEGGECSVWLQVSTWTK